MSHQNPTLKDLKAFYDREGYAIFRNVLDIDLIAETAAHIDWLQKKNPDLRPENLDYFLMTKDAFWVRLISDDRLLNIAQEFVGKNIALFASHYIAKPPKHGKAVTWHQDGSFWALEPMNVVTLWLAIDRSDVDNGCMNVIPQSQNMTLIDRDAMEDQSADEESLFGTGIRAEDIDESKAVNLVLQPGDVSVHHPNIIHGSLANHSERWRRGLTIRYIPTTTKILKEQPYPSAFLLRGEAVEGINVYNPFPPYVEGENMPFEDWEAWNEKCAAWNAQHTGVYSISVGIEAG